MSNNLRMPLAITSVLLPLALLGCQTSSLNHSAQTSPVIDDKEWSAITLKPRLFQTITKYEWQLTHVSNDDGKIIPFSHKPPLVMNVRPDTLLFQEGCHRYQGNFEAWRPLPYPYSLPDMSDMPDSCEVTTSSSITSNSNKGEVQQALDVVFAPYSNSYFRFDPILPNNPLFSKKVSKQMRLTTDKGKVFIFSGRAKPIKQTSGLAITNELLERYRWQLVQVTDKTGAVMSEFTQTEKPITLSYGLNNYSGDENDKQNGFQSGVYGQSFGISVGCNGIGGPYALSVNQSLLTGSFPSTMMSCGDTVDDIESRLRRMIAHSKSQLILTHADNKAKITMEQSEPNYLLTQTLDSGEMLVWKNVPKKVFDAPANNNDND